MDLKFDPITQDLAIAAAQGRPSALDVALASGAEEAAGRARNRLGIHEGEFEQDLGFGFPWRRIALVRNPDLGLIRAAVARVLAGTRGVQAVRAVGLRVGPDRRGQLDVRLQSSGGAAAVLVPLG